MLREADSVVGYKKRFLKKNQKAWSANWWVDILEDRGWWHVASGDLDRKGFFYRENKLVGIRRGVLVKIIIRPFNPKEIEHELLILCVY